MAVERATVYLELFGETRPFVDTAFAELIPASAAADAPPVSGASAPVYEYWWTIGHPGLPREDGRFPDWLHRSETGEDPDGDSARKFWDDLDDPAARVYVFFPRNGGWRIKELVATVKYLSPVPQQADFWSKAVQSWTALQPLVQDASTLAGALGPAVGVPARGAVTTLNALAELKLSSVPQGAGLDWSVGKVTFGHPESTDGESSQDNADAAQRSEADPVDTGVMQGVVWTLPAKMFTELGGRLTGSLAVTFIPCGLQMGAQPASGEPTFQPRAILAHAVVYPKGGDPCWVPAERRFIRLHVAPQTPTPTAGSSGT
jgi:hypothetical protein